MEMSEIIKIFDEDETKFAEEAVLEAKKNKGKINDYLLEHVSKAIEETKKNDEYPISVIYSVYLLSEFEEKRLFPILIKMFGSGRHNKKQTVDSCLVDRLNSILVSVFDGNFEAINKIIENENINEYVRKQFLRCYIYFYNNNMIDSKELEKYLLRLINLYNYKDDGIYDEILEVIINTHLFTMMEDVKRMFYYGVIDLMIRGGYDDFIDSIFDYDDTLDKFSKIEDTIKEMSWWYCFKGEDAIDSDIKIIDKKFEKLLENDLKQLNSVTTTKVGRNDPCPCGSGKKYKKCCIDKEQLTLPYQSLIDKSLSKYPKKKDDEERYDLYDFYNEEYIEIDKLLYKALKHKCIPPYIKRDYETEDKINIEYFNDAFEKIKNIVKEEKFNTIDDYDNKVSIHYSLYHFFQKYGKSLIDLLDNPLCSKRNIYLSRLKDLLDFFYSSFDLDNESELLFLDTKYLLYNIENKYDEGIQYFEGRLENCIPCLKYDIYHYLFDLYMCKYDDISKIEKLIDKEEDEELKVHLEDLKLEYMEYADY